LTKYSPDTISAAGSSTAPASSDIYGGEREKLEEILRLLLSRVDEIRDVFRAAEDDNDPVEHCLGRIKSDESMREKCRRNNLPETAASALQEIHDAIGIRVVCAFLNDVYMIRDRLLSYDDIELIREKDYIRHAKPNGYRSLHLIVRVEGRYYAEFQLRTISMDTWAALEHHMKYKKKVSDNTGLLVNELKRCADELASTDISMQTLRDMIRAEQSV
jgi:ppGpp synthetase/RelA/SpoT-type nucleotidyltranferase